MDQEQARIQLRRLLRLAYSGELAAARAYAGHWRSVRDPQQRADIKRIMGEELVHRQRVGEMLRDLDGKPGTLRDKWMWCVGTSIAASCFLGGWYIPMYGAGRIERRNIVEYEIAARHAAHAGLPGFASELIHMAEVEWDHEAYFHNLVRGHWLHTKSGSWPSPGARDAIRSSFEAECAAPLGAREGRLLTPAIG